MKITLELSDIDYGKLVEQFLPMVKDTLSEADGIGMAILSKIAAMPPSFAKKMVDILPQDTKDDIAVLLLNKNKEKIVSAALDYAEKNNLSFKIDQVTVENE